MAYLSVSLLLGSGCGPEGDEAGVSMPHNPFRSPISFILGDLSSRASELFTESLCLIPIRKWEKAWRISQVILWKWLQKWCRLLLPTCRWLELGYTAPTGKGLVNWNPRGRQKETWNWWTSSLCYMDIIKNVSSVHVHEIIISKRLHLSAGPTLLLLSRFPLLTENSLHSLLCWKSSFPGFHLLLLLIL